MKAFFASKGGPRNPKPPGYEDEELMFSVESLGPSHSNSFRTDETDEVPNRKSPIQPDYEDDDEVFTMDERNADYPTEIPVDEEERYQITVDEISEDMQNAHQNDVEMMYDASLHSPRLQVLEGDSATVPESPLQGSYSSSVPNTMDMCSRVGLDDFELLKVLGKGSFAKVMLVRKKDSQNLYAMKVLNKETVIRRNQVEHTLTERNVLQEVQHPFIVSLQYAFQTKSKLYFVMDFLSGGELFFHLKRETFFSEEVARFYSAEIVLALGHLHRLGIIYRDLKPENILLDAEGHVRLTDFGLAKEFKGHGPDTTRTFCGTIEYMAPEVLMRTGHGKAVDWWSLGTLIYEMLTGAPPFYSKNRNMLQQKIVAAKLQFPSYLTQTAKDLLAALLRRDASRRLGAGIEDSFEIMRHAWFAGVDWVGLLDKNHLPPFKPYQGMHPQDVNNFDLVFTRQTPKDTPVDSFLSASADRPFEGFTYIPNNHFPIHSHHHRPS